MTESLAGLKNHQKGHKGIFIWLSLVFLPDAPLGWPE